MMWAPVRSRALRCQPSMRLATTSRWTVKCGIVVQLDSVRSAIVRHALLTAEIARSVASGRGRLGRATVAPSATRTSLAWTGRPRSRREGGEIDARLARHPPRERRCRSAGEAACSAACVRASPGARIRAITLAHRSVVARVRADGDERAVRGRLELDRDLVGLDLDQRLALAHRRRPRGEPAHHAARVLGDAERRHDHVGRPRQRGRRRVVALRHRRCAVGARR